MAVVAFCPDGVTRGTFDELRRDAKTIPSSSDGTFEDVHRAEFFADFRSSDRFVAKLQHFRARINFKARDFGEFGDDVFGHAIAKIFVFFCAA